MSLNYTTYLAELSTLTAIPTTDVNFQAIVPGAIDYAEGRVYRELDALNANIRDSSLTTTAGSRNFILPTDIGTFLIVDGINVITPSNTAADSGTRVRLTPVSLDFLDYSWPSSVGATVPQYFAYYSQNTQLTGSQTQTQVMFGPWPDATYTVEVVGKFQPQALSASNPTTWLSLNLPDVFIAASMVFMSGYMKNFGGQSDDAAQAQSWEGQLNKLMASANVYEARKRFSGASWTAKQVEPTAVAQRG